MEVILMNFLQEFDTGSFQMFDHLFIRTEIICHRCKKMTVNQLNHLVICECCGWYKVLISIGNIKVKQ